MTEKDTITKVAVHVPPNYTYIKRIVFYDKERVLADTNPAFMGEANYSFEIGANERLVGIELDHDKGMWFTGITFIKWKID